MQIKTIVEKDGEGYEFTAELTDQQHAFLIEYAVKTLFQQGLLGDVVNSQKIPTPPSEPEPESKPH